MIESNGFFFLLSFATVVPLFSETLCPNLQLLRTVDGQSICCNPVFNCPFDTQVKFCTQNGSYDTCEQCPWGTTNKLISSSVDIHTCFKVTRLHKNCPLDDTERVNENVNCRGFPCRCRWEECYYGEPCIGACSWSSNMCGINEEMNRKTGDCEPCEMYMFKNETGCQPCLWNEMEWRLATGDKNLSKSLNVTPVMSNVGSTTETKLALENTSVTFHDNSTDPSLTKVTSPTAIHITKDQQNGDSIPVVIGILASLLAIVIIAIICMVRRKNSTQKEPHSGNILKPTMANGAIIREALHSIPHNEMLLLPSNDYIQDNSHHSNDQWYRRSEQSNQKHA